VNERGKIQITDPSGFPEPVARLQKALAARGFLDALSEITGIPRLLADPDLNGGGIHMTGPTGRLDVHVDFNYLREKDWHRRLNILLYLNPDWEDSWGGHVELWDQRVRVCHHSFMPVLNRCVIFETSDISYHGVAPVTCPPDKIRKSFAGYYYTLEPSPHWSGRYHSTRFRARPHEKLKGLVHMPVEKVAGSFRRVIRGVRKLATRRGKTGGPQGR